MIHRSIWTSSQFLALSIEARLLFIGLITFADNPGRGRGAAVSLRAMIFPDDGLEVSAVAGMVQEVELQGLAKWYEVEGSTYYYLPTWSSFQKLHTVGKSRFPDPPDFQTEKSGINSPEEKGREGKRDEEKENDERELENPSPPKGGKGSRGRGEGRRSAKERKTDRAVRQVLLDADLAQEARDLTREEASDG